MNLVFHALFVLKVGACFLIGAKFSELCLDLVFGRVWLVIKCWCHYIMYVYWSARFVKCIYKKCMHRATWSVQLVALDMAQEFQTHTLFELFCMHSAEKILARDKKHRKKGCHLIPLVYSAFRQKFPKLWTSVAHSFLQQIAQNKNWAHPNATTLPRICKVEMQQAPLLYYSAKPQSGGILGCALVCPTSLYVRTIRFPTFCGSLPSVGAYSEYPAWSGCRRSADVPRADHDRVGSSPWQGGFKERVYCASLPSICLIFSTCKYAATAFNFKHKKTINVTDLSWPKIFRYRF